MVNIKKTNQFKIKERVKKVSSIEKDKILSKTLVPNKESKETNNNTVLEETKKRMDQFMKQLNEKVLKSNDEGDEQQKSKKLKLNNDSTTPTIKFEDLYLVFKD
ncbi:hypothetical protein CYY_004587 [Polysphondylium violaceum]|uniref:Uncharacterized protein n=1 Tax=Polysphondylium violaceum TaxID=133409 RepID=A0A8J4V4Z9_9MYCE|nr:hypothetical protein CYY_004587 [Polysphondylium violaceum]